MSTTTESPILRQIAEERARQVLAQGWSLAHDDEHTDGELGKAAQAYIVCAKYQAAGHPSGPTLGSFAWPFAERFTPSPDPVRNLVKAAALLVAEIERLQRLRGEFSPSTERTQA